MKVIYLFNEVGIVIGGLYLLCYVFLEVYFNNLKLKIGNVY